MLIHHSIKGYFMTRSYSRADLGLLYSRSYGLCNKCFSPIFVLSEDRKSYINIGEIAHNLPFSAKGPRANQLEGSHFIIDEHNPDNSYNNLILLCRNDHTLIDNDPFYTVEEILCMKNKHENQLATIFLNRNSKDHSLIRLINEYINFQNLNYSINDPTYGLPFDIVDIGDIDQFILQANEPKYYPFDDNQLNFLMKNILDFFYQLNPYIKTYYNLTSEQTLTLNRPSYVIPNEDLINIQNLTSSLKSSIYLWIQYCRTNNYS